MGVFDFGSEDVLLDIDAVCKKLCISRSSLERLRRSSSMSLVQRAQSIVENDDFAGAPAFPEPTLVLGRSPRWSARVLNAWADSAAALTRPSETKGSMKDSSNSSWTRPIAVRGVTLSGGAARNVRLSATGGMEEIINDIAARALGKEPKKD